MVEPPLPNMIITFSMHDSIRILLDIHHLPLIMQINAVKCHVYTLHSNQVIFTSLSLQFYWLVLHCPLVILWKVLHTVVQEIFTCRKISRFSWKSWDSWNFPVMNFLLALFVYLQYIWIRGHEACHAKFTTSCTLIIAGIQYFTLVTNHLQSEVYRNPPNRDTLHNRSPFAPLQ